MELLRGKSPPVPLLKKGRVPNHRYCLQRAPLAHCLSRRFHVVGCDENTQLKSYTHLGETRKDFCFFSTGFPHLQAAPASWPANLPPPDPFELLGLSTGRNVFHKEEAFERIIPPPNEQDIRKAYFQLAKRLHPDTSLASSSSQAFHKSKDASSVTSHSVSRQDFPSSFSLLGKKHQSPADRDSLSKVASSFEDLQWAYEAALAHLDTQRKHSHIHHERGSKATNRSANRGQNKVYSFEQGESGESIGKRRLQEQQVKAWQEQQEQARQFWDARYQWNEKHARKRKETLPPTAGTAEEDDDTATAEVFRSLFKRRLRDEEALDQANTKKKLTNFRVAESSPKKKISWDKSTNGDDETDAFLHAQYEELGRFGISRKEAEDVLGLPSRVTLSSPKFNDSFFSKTMLFGKNVSSGRKEKTSDSLACLHPYVEKQLGRLQHSERSDRKGPHQHQVPTPSSKNYDVLVWALSGSILGGISAFCFLPSG